jgi:hypothetical protein
MVGVPSFGTERACTKPVLSICISTYNRAAWLAHSLPRVLEQTRAYDDLIEVVVCDNTSSDETPAVTARHRHWPNLRIRRNERNVGMLGNLAVTAEEARGQFVWILGDDDLLVEGSVERVLAAIALHPDVELLYTNYAYTRNDNPVAIRQVEELIHGAIPISDQVRDEYAARTSMISAKSENCFTAIYCLIFRKDHALGAYGQDTSGPPFSSLPTCVPTTHYVVEHLFDRPAYWIGDPCVVVNMNVSWMRYAALFTLERFPEIFERMQARGAAPTNVDALRTNHLPQLRHWVSQIYFGSQRQHLDSFSMERLVRRFGHLPAFDEHWRDLRSIYARAFAENLVERSAATPDQLDAILRASRDPATTPISLPS